LAPTSLILDHLATNPANTAKRVIITERQLKKGQIKRGNSRNEGNSALLCCRGLAKIGWKTVSEIKKGLSEKAREISGKVGAMMG